jgi:hypothetical protein
MNKSSEIKSIEIKFSDIKLIDTAEKKRIKQEKRKLRLNARKQKRDTKKATKAVENAEKIKAGIPLNPKKPKGRWFNARVTKCDIETCNLNAICGLSYKKADRCMGHRTPQMYYVLNSNCIEKGCSKKAAYGYNYWAKFCLDHKEPAMTHCLKAPKSSKIIGSPNSI